ncbi:hypothetical protein GCM10008955_05900 [Deinococcus malanensis]|uniref:Uncharacterized protein n=1 Tax=Deinococcus malanensis TaxID=1706855 RepID=A0ABQ2EKX5_9DEIO|nr:hypothetical protein [Deinococcus malanensis]GGK15328.1 hypothetical protein GCM10008955_05900 [Deinococcus malanensis]
MRAAPRWALLALLASSGLGLGAPAPAPLKLQLTQGGALLTGRINVPRADEITGVWSGQGRARLLRCAPRCVVVPSLSLDRSLQLGPDARYRIVLGGNFKVGQKVSLVLRLRQTPVLNVSATVVR